MTATSKIPISFHAPAERVPIEIIHRQAGSLSTQPMIPALLNSVQECVLILNAQRQIVFASQNVLEIMPGKSMHDILGLRPGEALDCIHACDCEGGCGTSEFCRECGAVRAILGGLAGRREVKECRITRRIKCQEESLDLLVMATPLTHNGEEFCLMSVTDISHEKRRRALERIFFHDVINLAGGADGMLEELAYVAPAELRGDLEMSHAAVHELLEEVQTQRDLAAAERKELDVHPTRVNSVELLREVVGVYRCHPVAEGKHVRQLETAAAVDFTADPILLKRVLGNLVKNALEACAQGQSVSVTCQRSNGSLSFSVHNPSFMPRESQLQVFQRSFSTKGQGRGLGTYSVKILTEGYLQGKVGFTSTQASGTTFFVIVPLAPA